MDNHEKEIEALKRLRMRLADGAEFVDALRDARGADIALGLACYRALFEAAGSVDPHDAMRIVNTGGKIALCDAAIGRLKNPPPIVWHVSTAVPPSTIWRLPVGFEWAP